MSAEHSNLFPAAIGAVACIGIFLSIYHRLYKDSAFVRSWTLGATCLIGALVLQHMRLQQWKIPTQNWQAVCHGLLLIPAFLFAFGSLCYWHGVRRFLHLPTPWRSRLALGGVLLAGMAAYFRGALPPIGLNAFRDGFVAAVYGLAALDFLRATEAGSLRARGMRIFSGFSAAISCAFWVCVGLRFLPSIDDVVVERCIFVIIILTVCIGVFTAMLLFHEKRSAEIAALHEQAVQRERELMGIQTRKRISRSIHDSIAGANTSISLIAARVTPDATIEQCLQSIEQIKWLSRELGDDLSLVINGLESPSVSSRRWLGEARHYTVNVLHAAGITCQWTAEGFDDRPLGDALAAAEFQRSLKEVVHNINRHSGASAASFALAVQGGSLTVWIEDNGVGIPATRPLGRGLTGLRTAAAALRGTFDLESSEAGTRLRFAIPLPLAWRD